MDLGEQRGEKTTQTDGLVVEDKAVQTEAEIGSKENPFLLDDICDNHKAVSGDEDEDDTDSPEAVDDDKLFFGTAFEKVEEFDHHLDDSNPWHLDLDKPLFPS